MIRTTGSKFSDGDHLGAIAVPAYVAGIVGFLNERDTVEV
jgi:hypothetical protein